MGKTTANRALLKWASSVYLVTAALVFLATAASKLLSDFNDPRLHTRDPFLWFLPQAVLLVLVAGLEIAVALVALLSLRRSPRRGILSVLWLSSLFVIYRFGFMTSPDSTATCRCFGVGSLIERHLVHSEVAGFGILAFLLVAGSVLVLYEGAVVRGISSRGLGGLAAIALTGAFLSPSPTAAEESANTPRQRPLYVAEGYVREQVFQTNSQMAGEAVVTFRFSQWPSKDWALSWTVSHARPWDISSTEHIAYNGTDIFSITYSDKRLDANMRPMPNTPIEVSSNAARVCRGPYPIDHSCIPGLLWLVFRAGDHLEKNPGADIPNLLATSARTDPIAWACEFLPVWQSLSGRSYVSSGSFVVRTNRLFKDLIHYPEVDEPASAEELQRIGTCVDACFRARDSDLLISTYETTEVTNVGGVVVPTRFIGRSYSKPWELVRHYARVFWEGEVTNLQYETEPCQILPALAGDVTVQDWRFIERTRSHWAPPRFYHLGEDGWIISTNDARLQLPKGVPRFTQRTSTRARRGLHWTLLIICASALLAPLLLRFGRKAERRIL